MAEVKYYSKNEIICKGRCNNAVLIDDSLMHLIAEALTRAPADIVDQTFRDCVFYRFNMEKIAGMFLPKSLIQGKNLILLSEGLFHVSFEIQCEKILHEVAHYILCHETYTDKVIQGEVTPLTLEKRLQDLRNNEKEADKLRDKWLADFAEYQKQIERGD